MIKVPASGPATEAVRLAVRPTDWERRAPVRPGPSASRDAAAVCEIGPHWGAALPEAGLMIKAAVFANARTSARGLR